MLKTKEDFLQDPLNDVINLKRYPIAWQLLAFDDQSFRECVFSWVARHVGKVGHISGSGWDDLLWQLPQEYRNELFLFCSDARHISEWYEDFVATVGPVSQKVVSQGQNAFILGIGPVTPSLAMKLELPPFDETENNDSPEEGSDIDSEIPFGSYGFNSAEDVPVDEVVAVGPVTAQVASKIPLPLAGMCDRKKFNPEEDDVPLDEESNIVAYENELLLAEYDNLFEEYTDEFSPDDDE